MKTVLAFAMAVLPTVVFAATGEHHEEGVPRVVIYQFINVALLIGGIIYFTKDAAIQFFSERRATYVSAAKKSAIAREEAEKQFLDIKSKIEHLDLTEAESLAKAKAHAEEIKAQISAESKQVSSRIRDEAHLTAQLETKKAQRELREQLLRDSIEAARIVLSKDIGSGDQQKLQSEFVKSIEAVK